MDPEKGRFYRANALGQINGVGVILTVMVAGIVALANSSYDGKPALTAGLSPLARALMDAALLAPSIVMMLVQRPVELDADRRAGRIGWGVWPLFAWKPLACAGPTELRLTGGQGGRGWSISAHLFMAETGETVSLAVKGGELQIEAVMPFARRLGARIVTDPGLRRISESTMRRLVPEMFEADEARPAIRS